MVYFVLNAVNQQRTLSGAVLCSYTQYLNSHKLSAVILSGFILGCVFRWGTKKIRTLLCSWASEPCSLAFRVRANKEYAPNVWFSGAQTWSHKLSIRTMYAGDKKSRVLSVQVPILACFGCSDGDIKIRANDLQSHRY